MPSQMVPKDKAVLVRVYVEKPRKKRISVNHHHHHHYHYHIHQTIRREAVHRVASQGYDRKAELLRYSQRLRESAREAPSTPWLSDSKQSSNGNRHPTQIVPAQKKPNKHAGSPACFGDWKLLIPSFLRSRKRSAKSKERKQKQKHRGLSGNQITNIMNKLEVKRKRLIPKVFSTTSKRS